MPRKFSEAYLLAWQGYPRGPPLVTEQSDTPVLNKVMIQIYVTTDRGVYEIHKKMYAETHPGHDAHLGFVPGPSARRVSRPGEQLP